MKWFRFYSDALEDPKVQRLPGDLFKTWVNLLCLANKSEDRGHLPPAEDIAFALRMDTDTLTAQLDELATRGLLDEGETGLAPHNWQGRQRKSDDVTARVQEHRAQYKQGETLHETPEKQGVKQKRNVLDTDTDLETDTDSEGHPPTQSATNVRSKADTPADAGRAVPVSLDKRRMAESDRRRFDRFWSAYPRKVKKAEALRWWAKQQPGDDLLAAILQAIGRESLSGQWQRDNGQFIPHPPTWLNSRRWEDEPIVLAPVRAQAAPRAIWD